MISKILLLVVASGYVYAQQTSCSSGTCISVLECPEMLNLLNKKDRTAEELALLKGSQCGFQGNTPKVCCQEQCYNPDGLPGKCINIYKCPTLANMLKPPLSRPDNMVYVQNSICTGPDRLSVCCGPARNLAANQNLKCTGALTAQPPEHSSGCCGRDAKFGNRITGGNATSIDQYPWLALIEYSKNGGPIKTLCGGSLISGRYVLTAAHCVTGAILAVGTPKNVRFGEYDTSKAGVDCALVDGGGMDCNDGSITIGIEEAIPHPDYNTRAKQSKNDIALIRMKQFVPFTDFIRPICLPTVDITKNPPASFNMFAAGWGAVSESQPFSSVKLHVDLPFVPQDVCQAAYRAPGRTTDLWQRQMCAGGQPGKDSCRGDSGGPLMFEEEDSRLFMVLGVVSFGPTPCGLPNIPGVYTKVFEYNDWIRKTIRA